MRTVKDFVPWTRLLQPYYFERVSVFPDIETVRKIYQENPKLVTVLSHGAAASPPYINIALFDIMVQSGAADRSLMGVGWRQFYKVPGFGRFVRYVTQVDGPLGFDEFVELFASGDFSDFNVYPEGLNCLYGNSLDIQPFISPRFLEIAVRAGVPVLLVVHHGTQRAAFPAMKVRPGLARLIKRVSGKVGDSLETFGQVSIPNFLPVKIPELKFGFQLYHPRLNLKDLPEDKAARRAALSKEAEEVRALMQGMVDGLKHASAAPRADEPRYDATSKSSSTA